MGMQVLGLTKGKEPWQKEYIDFEFDGRNVSDFGLVAVFDGDRLNLPVFPEFENETSEINGAFGQLYWGTRVKALQRTFTLATDGMTENQLQDFRNHFAPGKYGKFIEPHLLGRYSYCRVHSFQDFRVIPFQKELEFMNQKIISNEYKGEIKITFCWDRPISYADSEYIDLSTSSNLEEDIRKIYVNNLPVPTSFDNLKINNTTVPQGYIGGGRLISNYAITDNEYTVNANSCNFVYYNPSTYECEPTISIAFTLKTNSGGQRYFINIGDDINNYPLAEIRQSSKLLRGFGANSNIISTDNKQWINSFKFTMPNVLYSINKAIQIAYSYDGQASSDFEEILRMEVSHERILEWAIAGLSSVSFGGVLNTNWQSNFNTHMLNFFSTGSTFKITFHGDTLETTVSYDCKKSDGTKVTVLEEKNGNMACSPYLKLAGGDSIREDGKINSCHQIEFSNIQSMTKISLNYKYCYI